jgi:hypothetical protein
MGVCLSQQAAPAAAAAVTPAAEAPIEAGGTVISKPTSTMTKSSSDAPIADPEADRATGLPHDERERRASVLTSGTQTDDEDNAEPRMLPALPSSPGPGEEGEFDVTAEDGGSSSMVSSRRPGSMLPDIAEYTTLSASPGMTEARPAPGSAQQRNRAMLMRVQSSGTPSVTKRAISETMQGRRHPMAVQMMSPQSKTDATGRRPVSPRPGTSSAASGGPSLSALLQSSTEDAATVAATRDRNISVDGDAAAEDPTPVVKTDH